MLGSTYYLLCINGVPRVKYLTELKATAFDFGVMTGLGAFALIFQILGSIVANRLHRRKPLWMTLAIAHRVVFGAVLLAPLLFTDTRACMWWIIAVFVLHDALANTSSPLWLSWMADIVPQQTMSRYWASRQRFITAANMVAMLAMAQGFDYFEKSGRIILGFTVLAIVGIVLGVVDILMFWNLPEPPNTKGGSHWRHTIVQPLKDRSFRPFLDFMGFWHFAIFLSAPFFNLFLIEHIGMSVRTVQLLAIPHSVGVVVASQYWGLMCDAYGFRRILQILSVGKAFTPLFYIILPNHQAAAIVILTVMVFVDGIMNAGVALATQGVLLKSTPRANRTMYIAASNFFSVGIAAAIAPVLAGKLIDVLNAMGSLTTGPYRLNGYHAVFAISAFMRLGAVYLAANLSKDSNASMAEVVRQLKSPIVVRVTRMVSRLHSADNEPRRIDTLRRLGALGNPLAIPELAEQLLDPSPAVREAAAEALAAIGVPEAAEPLADALLAPDRGLETAAARALGRIGGTDAVRALLLHLRRAKPTMLRETVASLMKIGDTAAIVPLIVLYQEHNDAQLRRQIAEALQNLAGAGSPDEVVAALDEAADSVH